MTQQENHETKIPRIRVQVEMSIIQAYGLTYLEDGQECHNLSY